MDLRGIDENHPVMRLAGDIAGRANGDDPRIALDPRLLADVTTLRRLASEQTSDTWPEAVWTVLVDYVAAAVHWARSRHLGPVDGKDDLLAAVELFRPVYGRIPETVPWSIRSLYEDVADIVDGVIVERADTWTKQGLVLLGEVVESRDPDTLERCLALLRPAVDVTPAGHPNRGQRLTNLCSGLLTLHRVNGDPRTADDAVAVAREAVAVTAAESPFLADCLFGLGMALANRATSYDDPDEDEAIAVLDQAAAAMADGHPKLVGCLLELGLRLGWKAASAHDTTAMERAVDLLRQAVVTSNEADPSYLNALGRLGLMLLMLHDRTGVRQHAVDSVAVFRRASDLAPLGHPDRPHHLCHQAMACRKWYEISRERAVIEEAVAASRAALAGSTSHSLRAQALGELGSALRSRFEESGDVTDLSDAVVALREATSLDAADASLLSELGLTLLGMHLATGDPALLDEAIQSGRAAVTASSPDDPKRLLRQNLVGRMLWHRGERTGDQEALSEAITVLGNAANEAPDDHPQQLSIRTNLGAALGDLYQLTGSVPALARAVAAHGWVVDRMPGDHVKRGLYLGNLGVGRYQLYRAAGEPTDLDMAIDTMRDAVQHVPARVLPGFLSDLTGALLDRYELAGDDADLDLAATCAQRAVTLLPDDHPWRCTALAMLGRVHQARHRHNHDPDALSQALRVLREAAAMPTAPIASRIGAARLCGDIALAGGKPDTALAAFSTAVDLLPLLSGRQLRRSDREQQLAHQHGVACDAAACAITLGQPDRAAELLEAGRTILHAQVLETRNDLSDLHARAPELADRFSVLREELATSDIMISTRLDDTPQTTSRRLDRRHELAREWADLMETIRTEYDGTGLFHPPRIGELLPAAADGPVITINVSRYRCDALAVTTDGVRTVPLPELSLEPLVERTTTFVRALEIACGNGRTVEELDAAESTIEETIAWVRTAVTQPIMDALGIHAPAEPGAPMPKIWWSPTSVLAFLPLHAAAVDHAVSSYVPTIGALLRARARSKPGPRGCGLIVALPNTPGHPRLPGVTLESDLLTELFPATDVLRGPAATRSAVLRELPAHGWVHLACHGRNDIEQPSRSNIQLWDGPLAVRDIFGLDTDHGDLAFLTACETAQGGSFLADEALHIGGAFQLAGYVHVIATLWPAHDGASVELTEAFYRQLHDPAETGPNPNGSAEALHTAIRDLRDRHPAQPSRWAPYLHFGP